MSYRLRCTLTVFTILIACMAWGNANARAESRTTAATTQPAAAATTLQIWAIAQPDNGGQHTPVVAHLATAAGAPVPNAVITFFVDGQRDGEAKTNAHGNADWRLRTSLTLGRHTIAGVFDGTSAFLPSRATTTFTVSTTRLNVRIAPELSQGGARFPIAIHLASPSGTPLKNARVDVLIDNTHDGQVWTDAQGNAVWRVQRDLPAGTHAVTAVFDGLSGFAAARSTAQFDMAATRLNVQATSAAPLTVGKPFTVTAQLTAAAGTPVEDGRLVLTVNGTRMYEVRTDATGAASWRLPGFATTGVYTPDVSFEGKPGFLESQTTAQIQVKPAMVTIQTVPAVAGVHFALDDRAFVSDAGGVAQIEVDKVGTYDLKMLPWDGNDPETRVTFTRWTDNRFIPQRDVQIPIDAPLQAGLEVSYRVKPTFVSGSGQQIDPARIQTVTLTGNDGTGYTFNANQPMWLKANQIVRNDTGIEERKILYALRNVVIDQANVVNEGQQRFSANARDPLNIEVQIYTARFFVRDAFFGTPIGSALHLTFPDGSVHSQRLGSDAALTFASLARGNYSVKVDARGISSSMPIVMARDQDVYLIVLSYFDLGVAAALGVVVAIGLLLIGRPQVLAFGRGTLVFAGSAIRRPTQLRAHIASFRSTLANARHGSMPGPTTQHAVEATRPAASATRRIWRRVFDPMFGYALALVLFGAVGFRLAGVEAASLHGHAVTVQPTVAAADEAPARPVTSPVVPTPRPTTMPPTLGGAAADGTEMLSFDRNFAPGQNGLPIAQLQQRLRALGYFTYPENTGFFGKVTQDAVAQFQTDHQLPSTGIPDRKTINALNQCGQACVKGSGAAQAAAARSEPVPTATVPATGQMLTFTRNLASKSRGPEVVHVQQRLRELQFFDYPDNTGYFGEETAAAVSRFQTARGLPITGIVDGATIDALNRCGEDCLNHK